MQIIAVAMQKGGTGKTTTAAAISQAAAHNGRKVLAIDIDPQANLSYTLAADMRLKGTYELLNGEPVKKLIQRTSTGVDVIASNEGLATMANSSARGSARRLQEAIRPLTLLYDLIVIDCPPANGELQYNALQASTELIIPTEASQYSRKAVADIIATAQQIQQSNALLTIKGLVFTCYNPRSTLSKQMYAAISSEAAAQGVPTLAAIREGIAIKEAQALRLNLFDYAPKSKPALDYMELYNKIRED